MAYQVGVIAQDGSKDLTTSDVVKEDTGMDRRQDKRKDKRDTKRKINKIKSAN